MRWRRPRDEQGSIMPMTIFIVVVVIALSAVTVDLGMKRVARRDMQSVADVVALDMARYMKGRTKATILADPEWATAKNRSVARNSTVVGTAPTVVTQLGTVDAATGVFTESASGAVPTAVRVIASNRVDFTFTSGDGAVSRSAIASIDPGVCFSVGSFAAALSTNEAGLNGLLGSILGVSSLTLVSPGGIATVKDLRVPLLGIASELGVGTADELMNLSNLSVADFVVATATVLNRQGDTAGATFLNAIAARLRALPVSPQKLAIADILQIAAGNNAALNLDVSVLDLLGGALYVANGENLLLVPNLGLNLSPLASTVTRVKIIEPPKIACGKVGVQATSSQVQVTVGASVLGTIATNVGLDLTVDAASATGTLTSMTCGNGVGTDSIGISVVPSLAKLLLKLDVTVLLGLIKATVDIPSLGSSAPRAVSFTYPAAPGLPAPQRVAGITTLNLSTAHLETELIGISLGPLVNSLVRPLLVTLDPVLVALLTPVLKLVGADLGGADVAPVSRIACDAPRLQG